jgi:hypothetical protein
MFDAKHYVPVLRWKRGEQGALRKLYDYNRRLITPLIELPARNTMPEKKARLGLEGMLAGFTEQILENWGRAPLFFDPASWSGQLRQTRNAELLSRVFQEANEIGLRVIPVTGLGRAMEYQTSIASIRRTNPEACVRLRRQDLVEGSLGTRLYRLLGKLGIRNESTHIVLDLGVVDSEDEDLANLVSRIPAVSSWATLTVVGGSFPKDLSGLRPGQYTLPRREWQAWRKAKAGNLRRLPTFGDYTTLNPVLSPYIRGMNISASIRYTAEDYWIIMRGEGLRNDDGPGAAQYPANAELLTRRPEYCGSMFSYGDSYVAEIGLSKQRTGSPTTWLQAGVNHHLTFAAQQVAS